MDDGEVRIFDADGRTAGLMLWRQRQEVTVVNWSPARHREELKDFLTDVLGLDKRNGDWADLGPPLIQAAVAATQRKPQGVAAKRDLRGTT